jgi:uroporphyrinogen III methyltransferase/synthase
VLDEAMCRANLAGVRVLLTRPQGEGSDEWAAAFTAAGATAIPYPTIAAVGPASWESLDAALAALDSYDWLVFTSQTAVAFVSSRMVGHRFAPGLRPQIAAVGDKTAEAVVAAGGRVSLVPTDKRQEGLVQSLADLPSGSRVLLPMAARGRSLLPDELRARGMTVDVVAAYETRAKNELASPPPFDIATFASPSALRAFLAGPGKEALAGKTVAVIGPTTAEEARADGLRPVLAESPNVHSLIRAIAKDRQTKGDL